MRALRTLALALPLAAALACQENNMSYDAINGPENVRQAPLFSAENSQLDSTNLKLYRQSIADSAFYSQRQSGETMGDSAGAIKDTSVSGKDPATAGGVDMSNDKVKTKGEGIKISGLR